MRMARSQAPNLSPARLPLAQAGGVRRSNRSTGSICPASPVAPHPTVRAGFSQAPHLVSPSGPDRPTGRRTSTTSRAWDRRSRDWRRFPAGGCGRCICQPGSTPSRPYSRAPRSSRTRHCPATSTRWPSGPQCTPSTSQSVKLALVGDLVARHIGHIDAGAPDEIDLGVVGREGDAVGHQARMTFQNHVQPPAGVPAIDAGRAHLAREPMMPAPPLPRLPLASPLGFSTLTPSSGWPSASTAP